MAKVFPVFLVVVLVLAVLLFAIPSQQPANAYIRPNTPNNLFAGQTYAISGWLNAPENGFFFTLKCTDNSLLPRVNIFGEAGDGSSAGGFFLCPVVANGVYYYNLSNGQTVLNAFPTGTNYTISYYTTPNVPQTRHVFVYRVDGVSYLIYFDYAKAVSKFCVSFENQAGLLHTVQDFKTSPYTYDKFVLSASRGILESVYINNTVSFTDDQKYQAGFVAGSNSTNTAVVNVFPAFIGSIFAFFMSIASYEILGISLLHILILVGSILLLLAVLRVFLK